MDNFFYFKIIKKTTIQLLNVFNNLKIAKFDSTGNISKNVDVPIKLSGKQKFYYWLFDRRHEKRLPMMALNFMGITPAVQTRGKDSNYFKIPTKSGDSYVNPIPWDYEFELYISANYVIEVEQILEQILPFFSPFIMTNIELPEINNNLDLKVICESATQDQDVEIPEEEYRTINWTLSFRVIGYLLKPVSDINNIEDIYVKFKNMNLYNTDTLSADVNYENIHIQNVENSDNEEWVDEFEFEDEKYLWNYEILSDDEMPEE